MDYPHQVAGRLDEGTYRDLERLAAQFSCTVEHLVTTAVMRFVSEESRALPNEVTDLPGYRDPNPLAKEVDEAERKLAEAWAAYLKPAEDDIAAGRLIDHEDVMRELRERYSSRDAAA